MVAIIAAKLASETQLTENNIPWQSLIKWFSAKIVSMSKLSLFLIHTGHMVAA